jgi:outer membrane murein-binding lipoprotein Lpp
MGEPRGFKVLVMADGTSTREYSTTSAALTGVLERGGLDAEQSVKLGLRLLGQSLEHLAACVVAQGKRVAEVERKEQANYEAVTTLCSDLQTLTRSFDALESDAKETAAEVKALQADAIESDDFQGQATERLSTLEARVQGFNLDAICEEINATVRRVVLLEQWVKNSHGAKKGARS